MARKDIILPRSLRCPALQQFLINKYTDIMDTYTYLCILCIYNNRGLDSRRHCLVVDTHTIAEEPIQI